MERFFIAFILVVLLALVSAQNTFVGSVFYNSDTKKYSLKKELNPSAISFGSFADTLNETGWGVLKVQTNKKFNDPQQMFAAGYLEGALTFQRIFENYHNMYNVFFKDSPPSSKLMDFLKRQDLWVRTKIIGNFEDLTDYWKGVALIVAHFDGLVKGYQDTAPTNKALTIFAFQMLNGVGDFLDLLPALDESRRIDWNSLSPQEISRKIGRSGHCSALIKIPGDLSDLFTGHSSWFVYAAMNRIYKHYYFDLHGDFVAARKMTFSSYPGFLVSLDDFYMMNSGLAMVQTTNSILNDKLFEKVTSSALFAWQRVRLANLLSHDGQEWSHLFAEHNSGTYNNQYMVVDYKRFQVGVQVGEGTLWVVEQIPGLVEFADVTSQLERGYWSSYNVPYFPRIYNESGYTNFVKLHGVEYSYQMAPRAQIFRRDQGKVTDLQSFKDILRYNDYLHDPVSNGDPGKAICSRFDLESNDGHPSGCYDTKVTNLRLFSALTSHAINGPTTSHNIPPFQWSSKFNGTLHEGMPKVFDFSFVVMEPKW